MKLALFNSKPYDIESFNKANQYLQHDLQFIEAPLNSETARLARGTPAICIFVNDMVDELLLQQLYDQGVRLVLLRCAGYNNVNIAAAGKIGIQVANVPAYSPHAVAEHALGLIFALNRHLIEADHRVRTSNFSLQGLKGFDLHGKTAGVIGTGRIGAIVACSLQAMGMRVLATDPVENPACCNQGVQYVDLDTLLVESDIISLHCPLTDDSCYLIGETEINKMKQGVMIINTSRGAVLKTQAIIKGLESGKIGYLGIDVYEKEKDLFFRDLSGTGYEDDLFKTLLTFPNVLITPHQAFFTNEALDNIAMTTLGTLNEFEHGQLLSHEIK